MHELRRHQRDESCRAAQDLRGACSGLGAGDPRGRTEREGLLGAVNYLASRHVNAMSFLSYNAGGDGDNVWPFVSRDDKFHYDVSKLDQWQIVFEHAQRKGIYLHFKLQETENDDNVSGNPSGGRGAGGTAGAGRGGPLSQPRPRVARRRRPRSGTAAVSARDDRALWLSARHQLEPRRRKHPDRGAAAGNGRLHPKSRSARPSHRAAHVPPTRKTRSMAGCSASSLHSRGCRCRTPMLPATSGPCAGSPHRTEPAGRGW